MLAGMTFSLWGTVITGDTTVVITGIIAFLVIWTVLMNVARRRKCPPGTKKPPGPMEFPLIKGSASMIWNRNNLLQWMEGMSTTYGTTAQAPTPHMGVMLMAAEPESAEYILKTNFKNYPKGPLLNNLFYDLLGHGIFASDGDHWRSQRKTFSHLFKVENMKTLMYDTFREHAKQVLECLELHAENNKELEIQQLFYKYTLDSIGEIAFGKNIGSLQQETPVSLAFDHALKCTERRLTDPLWKIKPNRGMDKSLKILDEYAYTLIAERRLDPNVGAKSDLLSSYITNTEEDDHHLRDVIMNFLIAGRDTTGQTLTWLFYLLSQNPEVEAKLLEEIDALNGAIPTYREFSQMEYLHGVVNETLRLYPAVPFDGKFALEDDVLPNGYFVEKGSTIFWSAWVMGRHPKFWSDPLKMEPRRWIDQKTEIHPYLFIPFQAGPRICLGQAMAYLEAKLVTIMILQKFRMRAVPDHIVAPMFNITLNSKDGVKMTVHPRA